MTRRARGDEPTGGHPENSSTETASREMPSKLEYTLEPQYDDESQAASNETAEVVRETDLPDASALLASLSQEAIIHFYMAEALERITDQPDLKARAVEIKRIEAAQVEPFPPRAVTCDAKKNNKLRRLVETGTEESFWEAFHVHDTPSLVSDLIAYEVEACPGSGRTAESALESLLQQQAAAQLWKALELARIADEPHQEAKAIEIMLAEAEQLTDRDTVFFALQWLSTFERDVVIPRLMAFLRKADDVPAREAAFEALERLITGGSAPDASESSAAAPGSEGPIESVEHPRKTISPSLTIPLSADENSPVPRMDESQGVSLDSTAAPLPELEVSLQPITVNAGGDGFSSAQSSTTAATAVHTDQLDLASVSFTTEDPAVLRARMLFVSEPAEHLSRLDVFEHGRGLLARVQTGEEAPVVTKRAVQEYLDRLVKTGFGGYAISAKEDLAQTVTTLIEDSGLKFLCRDSRDGCVKNITRVEVFVPNERSHGSFQLSVGGRPITSASWPAVRTVLPHESRKILGRRTSN